MKSRASIEHSKNFYKEFHETNQALLFGLIIISCGLYIINWIYMNNKDFETLDKFAPNSNRGAVIMMILPFSWFFIIYILKHIIIGENNLFLEMFEIVGWGLILTLLIKYLLDFTISFGRITKTNGLFWFLPFLITIILCSIGVIFKINYLFLSLIIPVIIILSMQSELNLIFVRFKINKDKNIFYN